MPRLSDVKVDSIFGLFKGEPGTRKSTQALSFPTPQYWVSTDRKMNGIVLPARKWSIDLNLIEYDDYRDWNAIEKKVESLRLNNKYKTIIIDSITTTGDNINLQTLSLKKGTTTKAGAEAGMRVGGITINTLEDYKAEASAFSTLISLLKDIKEYHNCHIVLIAHVVGERKKEETAGITSQSRIIITGGKTISGKIPAFCDEVYHFDVSASVDVTKPPEYICYTVHTGVDFARTALDLPGKITFNDRKLYDEWIKPALERNTGKSDLGLTRL